MTRNAAEVPKWTGQRSQSIIYKKDILALYYLWMGMLSQSLTSLSPYAGDCVSSGIIPSRQRSCSFELSFILVSISQGGSFICLPFLEARARRESEKKLGGEPCSTRCPTAGAAGSNIPTEVVALLHPLYPFICSCSASITCVGASSSTGLYFMMTACQEGETQICLWTESLEVQIGYIGSGTQ